MSPDFSPELQRELLDDFYAECDEHLGSIRKHLANLEHTLPDRPPDPAILTGLFRSVHSFKGITAIIGLRSAERITHASEGLLRDLCRSTFPLSPAHVETFATATQRLEQIVTAHRLQQPAPPFENALLGLAAYDTLGEAPAEASGAPDTRQPSPELTAAIPRKTAAPAPGVVIWRAVFSPSAELDRRGINLNAVRARLSALGEIVSAAPSIEPGGTIRFEFDVALRSVPADLTTWASDGVTLQPVRDEKSAVEAPGGEASSTLFIAPSHIVRVDLSRLDELMRITGEMVIHRSRLEERISRTTGDRGALQEVNLAFGRSLRELREALTRVRLVPVAEIFSRMPFVLRDLTRDTGKKIRLVLEGQHTEIDKYLVERLKEPLLHLVRNAASHGVELPEERLAASKPAEATLSLRASAVGQAVIIQIRDDGRGIDARSVLARAAEAGIIVPVAPSEHELLAIICRPGFSTREQADRASGRGVGMAVVHETVRDLGGTLSLQTKPGEWTQFTLRLPLTLSIAEVFIVTVAGQTCAVPQGVVEEILLISEAAVRTIQQAEVVSYRDGILPLVRLRTLFGAPPSSAPQTPVMVLSSEQGLCGLVVDRVEGQREVVVRSMRDPLIQAPGVSGATELGDGRPVLILDAAVLARGVVRPRQPRLVADPPPAPKIS